MLFNDIKTEAGQRASHGRWIVGRIFQPFDRSISAVADDKRPACCSNRLGPQKPRSLGVTSRPSWRSAGGPAADLSRPRNAARAVQGNSTARRALVIGNGAYTSVERLKNPANDASAVAGALTRLGFDVVEKHDLGVLQMQRALRDFEDKAEGAEWALVYYAGHGLEQNGSWLIPVDAR